MSNENDKVKTLKRAVTVLLEITSQAGRETTIDTTVVQTQIKNSISETIPEKFQTSTSVPKT